MVQQFAMYRSRTKLHAQRCRRSHRTTTSPGGNARLRRNTPRELAKDKSAFDAAVPVRRKSLAAVAAALLTHGADLHAKDNHGCGGRSLFWAAVGAGRGRPGRDRCAAVLDAPTHTRAIHSRTDLAVCMRLNTHTDARTKARIDIHIHTPKHTHP